MDTTSRLRRLTHAILEMFRQPVVGAHDVLVQSLAERAAQESFKNAALRAYAGMVVAFLSDRPKRPKDKAKVEAAVRIVQMWILAALRKRVFYSLAEANTAIHELLEVFNNRPFKKMKGSRTELFEQIDKPALRPLPPQPYEYADWKIGVRVGLDYMVDFEGQRVSAGSFRPPTQRTKTRFGSSWPTLSSVEKS